MTQRLFGWLVLIALGLATQVAGAEQIYIYDRPGFVGEDYEATFDVPDLSGTRIAGKSASLRARTGIWLVCTEPNYRGNCLWLWHAQISNLDPWGFAGNVRSLKLYRTHGERFHFPTRLHLYAADFMRHSIVIAENDYEGGYRTITGDVPDLKAAGIDFPVGAFIVTGRPSPHAWALCTEPNYRGRCITSVQGNDVMAEVFTDRIASIRALPNLHAPSTDPPPFFRHRRW
ncbi:MAG: hypothetical protein GC190_11840 [Alphaproteobacteria bacterium]|nr:hypothetical protein [Alphaproteobacteria bacterium]